MLKKLQMRKYRGRYFKVCIKKETDVDSEQLIISLFSNLGYELELAKENKWVFKRGSRVATYAGLINWKLIFRRIVVEWLPMKKEVCLTYMLPWATNIGLLSGAAKPELIKIAKSLNSKPNEIKFIRKR